ncbi:hypothetical protein ACIHFC_31610 [Streptomyces sp. NPDC052013]|uniref:hypothetical protein n=1 Tax=Streptomyces sp. NPDC052013 TaxID=3365679 RepID=UPI0037D46741
MEPGTDGQAIRKYRLGTAQLVFVTLFLGLPGIPLALSIVPEEDLTPTFKAGTMLLLGTVYLAVLRFWRAATIVYGDHIAVRQLFRTRRTVWSDVLSIESESGAASSRTMLLDREGRLFALPGGVGARAEDVRAVKDVWTRSRGGEWTPPDPAVVEAARRRAEARESALVWAVFLTTGSFLALLVSGFVLETRSHWDGDDMPWVFQAIGFVPVVVFTAVYQVAVRLLRRRHAANRP